MIADLTSRARDILRLVVDSYVETGEPVGSRTIAQKLSLLSSSLSPATIRNVMADLEEAGLLYAPHTSAGRLPTDAGLRLFVDGLLERGNLAEDERNAIEGRAAASNMSLEDMLQHATTQLSSLSRCAGLVLAPKTERPLKQIEFVPLSPGRALVVLVTEDGLVENRVIQVPLDMSPSNLTMASNFLNARLAGKNLESARQNILSEIAAQRSELDQLTAKVVEAGLGVWSGATGQLIVRGQANLLHDIRALEELERIRSLFTALETRETMLKLLEAANSGEGVQIFIGAENNLFEHTGCSLVIAPYQNSRQQIVGAIGVIGPTRLNYARIIPMVDYTARVISKMLDV